MKKELLTVSLVLIHYLTFAQFTFDKSYNPNPGLKYTTFKMDTSIFEGNKGGNQTWDFSNLAISKPIGTTTYSSYVPVANDSFLLANLLVKNDSTPSTLVYYRANANGLDLIGAHTSTPYQVTYTLISDIVNKPVQNYWSFPLNYNQIQFSNFKGVTTSYLLESPGTINMYRSGSDSIIIDAFGKIILTDNISYDNVIRVKQVQQIVDSSKVFDNVQLTSSYITTYNFYAENINYPVAQIIYTKVSIDMVFGGSKINTANVSSKNVTISKSSVNGIENISFQKNFLSPNPIQSGNQLTIDETIQSLEIMNSLGEVLIHFENKNDVNMVPIELPNGIYLVKGFDRKGNSYTQKLIVN